MSDEWLDGSRRWDWECTGDPWADERRAIGAQPFSSALRMNPPLRSVADASACREALLDGTADAIATDHAPHTSVDKDVEFGAAANGISGLETALGVVLAMVDAGLVPLRRAIEALTVGPARVLGSRWGDRPAPRLVEGAAADLVVFDRSASWRVSSDALVSRGKNTPLLERELPGVVLLTVAGGRLAYEAPGD